MIVVSKERYLPVMINTIVLSKENWYFYIHRDVYDQAVVLSDRFDSVKSLVDLLGGTQINEATVAWFYANAPKPLNILAPYLSLIDGEIEKDMELCGGVLHVITAMINVRSFILKPIEIRKSVSFSLTIREEYELAWERFFLTAVPYEQRESLARAPAAPRFTEIPQAEETATALLPTISGYSDKQQAAAALALKASTEAERNATKRLLL